MSVCATIPEKRGGAKGAGEGFFVSINQGQPLVARGQTRQTRAPSGIMRGASFRASRAKPAAAL